MMRAGCGRAATAVLLLGSSVMTGLPAAAHGRGLAGVVSSATPEATQAGVAILNAGGNAVDAAVAVAFVLGVTEPAGSGLGGQTFLLIHPPDAAPLVINGTSYAPRNLPRGITAEDISGHRASTVPSTVRVLEHAWRRYGSGRVAWPNLLAAAIRYAEEGYELGRFRHRSLARYAHQLRKSETVTAQYLAADGQVPEPGAVMRNPVLARTLRRLAEDGADDFYDGGIAREIVADMKANGGWIEPADLAAFPEPAVVPPLVGAYRGWDVYTLPPPTGGWVVIQALNLLEHAPAGAVGREVDERWVWLAETLRIVHGNRAQAPVADPTNYQRQVEAKTDKQRATALLRLLDRPGGGETTHFSVADGDGMVVAVTQSLNAYFGARVSSPRLGFLYNDYMNEYELEQIHHPYALRPGAVPYSSMSATILARDGNPVLAIGSPGSRRIISAVIQVLSDWVDVGRGIEAAVAAPRIHVVPEEELFMESWPGRIPASLLLQLELRGYTIVQPLSSLYHKHLNPYFGGVHAVAFEGEQWTGAADPRRDGTVGFARRGDD